MTAPSDLFLDCDLDMAGSCSRLLSRSLSMLQVLRLAILSLRYSWSIGPACLLITSSSSCQGLVFFFSSTFPSSPISKSLGSRQLDSSLELKSSCRR